MTLLSDPIITVFDESGNPGVFYSLSFYESGTTTPKAAYSDALKQVPHPNPLIADAAGRFLPIWLDGVYKLVFKNELGAEFRVVDPVESGGALRIDLANTSNPALGSALVGYKYPGTGAVGTNVFEKLRGLWVDVKLDYGATGDGTTDDSVKVIAAIDAVYAAGGGTVYFPPGTYRARNVWARHKVKLLATPGAVTLKLPDNVGGQIIGNEWQYDGIAVDQFHIEGIIFDGNAANYDQGENPASAVAFAGATNFKAIDCIFKNATGYGLGFQSRPENAQLNGPEYDIWIENCHFTDNGFGTAALPGSTYDGLDFKYADRVMILNCHAGGNANDGLDFRGRSITLINCTASGNGGAGVEITASVPGAVDTEITIIGGHAFGNTLAGYRMASGADDLGKNRITLDGVRSLGNTTFGVEVLSGGQQVELCLANSHIYSNVSHGVKARIIHRGILVSNCNIRDNGGSGMFVEGTGIFKVTGTISKGNAGYGYEETLLSGQNSIGSGCDFSGNGTGSILPNENHRLFVAEDLRDYDVGASDIIASAGTITLPWGGRVFFITGTATITHIAPSYRGRVVYLHTNAACTFFHDAGGEGDLRLIGGANQVMSVNDVIGLLFDGAAWQQIAPVAANS